MYSWRADNSMHMRKLLRDRAAAVQAKQETEKAIQAGNHSFNAMLHERMGAEEKLSAQVEQLKLDITGKEQEAAALRSAQQQAQKDGAAALQRGEAAWAEQRSVLERQHEQVWPDQWLCQL